MKTLMHLAVWGAALVGIILTSSLVTWATGDLDIGDVPLFAVRFIIGCALGMVWGYAAVWYIQRKERR